MYVPPIHVDLVHFLGTRGAPVPYLHVDQNMSTTLPCGSEDKQAVNKIPPSMTSYTNLWKFPWWLVLNVLLLNKNATLP